MEKKILVVDDDPDILDAIAIILEYEGYHVQTTQKADYASTLTKNHQLPDLIILDVLLSGADGRDICKNLKKNIKTKHIPILMISAHPNANTSTKKSGADDFLAKPFDVDDLLYKVKKYVMF